MPIFKGGKKRVIKDESSEFGIVEKLSIQGDFLFAVVRKEGTYYKNEDNKIVKIKTELFGANGTPEQNLTLGEVLIPTDLLPWMITVDYNFFIGKKVEVLINKGIPRVALLSRAGTFAASRGISPEYYSALRGASKSRETTKEGKKVVIDMGFSEQMVESVLAEKYLDVVTDEDILIYGAEQRWDVDVSTDTKNKNMKDMSKVAEFQYVSGLKGKPQKSKSCYLPILSIGGKI